MIGIIVGSVLLVVALLTCVICILIRRKGKRKQRKKAQEADKIKKISIIGKNHKIPEEVELQDFRKDSIVSTANGDVGKQEYEAVKDIKDYEYND